MPGRYNDRCPDFGSGISYLASGSASESGFGSAFGSGSGLSMSCDELEPDSEERDFWHSITTVYTNVYSPSPDCSTIAYETYTLPCESSTLVCSFCGWF